MTQTPSSTSSSAQPAGSPVPEATPLVSVVIPTRQRPALLLSRALRTALAQSLTNIEVIVVVDGPDQPTLAALAQVSDPRVRVVALPIPVGGSEARNVGVRAARSPWIALLDDDDEWFPHKLEQQLQVARSSCGRPIVACGWIQRTPRGDTTYRPRPQDADEPFSEYLLARRRPDQDPCALVSSLLLVGRDLLLDVPFRPDLQKHQDWDWLLRAAARTDVQLAFTSEVAAIWYYEEPRHSVSRTQNWQLSRAWAQEHLQRGTMSRRAFVGFLNSHVSPAAQLTGDGHAAALLLRDLLRAGPRPFELARFLLGWLIPLDTRRQLRLGFDRLWGKRRGAHPDRQPPATPSDVTLIDPLDTGHHIGYACILAAGLVEQGVRVRVIGSAALVGAVRAQVPQVSGEVLPLFENGSEAYYRLPRRAREQVNIRFLRRALLLARAGHSQVAHLLYEDSFTQAFLLARLSLLGQLGPVKVRATLHWLYFLREYRPSVSPLGERLHLAILALLGRLGVRTMVHSRRLATQLRSRLPTLAVDTVPYFAEAPRHDAAGQAQLRHDVRGRLGLPEGARVALAFGGTRHDKGIDLAIQALAELPPEHHLLVVGPARAFDTQELRNLAERFSVTDRTHFVVEYVPDEDVEGYFVAADCVVLPYRRVFSGQSGPLLIAGALGRPVVASDVGVLAEEVREYSLGLLCAPEDIHALAEALRQLPATPFEPDTARFQQDHSAQRFTQATLASYRQ